MRIAAVVVLFAACACHSTSPSSATDDASVARVPRVDASTALVASASASSPALSTSTTSATKDAAARDVRDFENQFAFGGFDAGAGDATQLTTHPGYEPYANGRFSFGLEVPRAFVAMPDPENDDGRQWRIGNVAAMTASGMHAIDGIVGLSCANSPHVTAHKETKSTCWATGKRNGFIFWEREALAHDVLYSLRFQYVESMKTAMDPVVTHVNASWSF
jgi:hypothetical protein